METEEEVGQQRRREAEKGGEKQTLGTNSYQSTERKELQRKDLLLIGTWAPSNRNRVCDSGGDPVLNKKEITPSLYSCKYKLELMLNFYIRGKKYVSLSFFRLICFFFTALHSWPPILTLVVLPLQSISAVNHNTHFTHTIHVLILHRGDLTLTFIAGIWAKPIQSWSLWINVSLLI